MDEAHQMKLDAGRLGLTAVLPRFDALAADPVAFWDAHVAQCLDASCGEIDINLARTAPLLLDVPDGLRSGRRPVPGDFLDAAAVPLARPDSQDVDERRTSHLALRIIFLTSQSGDICYATRSSGHDKRCRIVQVIAVTVRSASLVTLWPQGASSASSRATRPRQWAVDGFRERQRAEDDSEQQT